MRKLIFLILLGIVFPAMLSAQWTQSKPPFGGFVHSSVVKGAEVFIATSGYGVFRSTDNGVTWSSVLDNTGWTPKLAVGGNALFLGDLGLMISTDDGESWQQTGFNKGGDTGIVRTIATGNINGVDEVFVGTYAGVFRSSDDGATWVEADSGLPHCGYQDEELPVSAMDVFGNVIFAGHDCAGLYKSTDNGESWSAIPGVNGINAFARMGDTLFTFSSGEVYCSTDSGSTWKAIDTFDRDGSTFYFTAIGADGNELYAGSGCNGIFRTTDLGTTWQNVCAPGSELSRLGVYTFCFSGGNILAGTYAGMFRSGDDGATWTNADSGLSADYVSCLQTIDLAGGPGIIAGTQFDGIFLSSNDGETWTRTDNGLDPTSYYIQSLIVIPDTGREDILAGSWCGGIARSTDYGASWQMAGLYDSIMWGYGPHGCMTSFALPAQGAGEVYAGTYGNGVYRSTDYGASWTSASEGLSESHVLALATASANDTDVIYAGVFNDLCRSIDHAATWTPVDSGLPAQSYDAYSLAASGSDVFVATSYGVYLSTNFGTNWNNISSGDIPCANTFAFSPGDSNRTNLFVGTCIGQLFLSTDNGLTWIEVDSGLTKQNAQSLLAGRQTRFAARVNAAMQTHGCGQAVHGSSRSAPEAASPVSVGYFSSLVENKTTVYAATYNYGVWHRPLSDLLAGRNIRIITASATGHGIIIPAGQVHVDSGGTQRFILSPAAGYSVDSLIVDGTPVDSTSRYTFFNVDVPHAIRVVFKIKSFIITATAGANGAIAPSGTIAVDYGGSRSFTVTPDPHYHIDSIIVDGVKIDSAAGYTFKSVSGAHTIRAVFRINTCSITATAGDFGRISPSGTAAVDYGMNKAFTAIPDAGCKIDSLVVDGINQGPLTGYTFEGVTSDHIIAAYFSPSVPGCAMMTEARWNIVSVPVFVAENGTAGLFPAAISRAYAYHDGYSDAGTMTDGVGYWLKFDQPRMIWISGDTLHADSISITEGWNLIGSITMPVAVEDVVSSTEGLTVSNFYGYSGSYVYADTIYPGKGYWVKANMAGRIILSAASQALSNKVRILPMTELPPSPPGELLSGESRPPGDFALLGNYPNPFNPVTDIQYALPVRSHVRLAVYSMLGQLVATLVDGIEEAGFRQARWNGSNVVSGMYFVRIEAASADDPAKTFSELGKMLLIK